MMQMPLSSYPHFSQFLQLHQLHQQRFSRTYPTPSPEIGMPSSRRSGGTSCSEASTGTPSSSPSPPLSIIENFPANGPAAASGKSAKSFTIDAILGIRDREIQDKMNGDHLNAIPGNFHPRLGLHLTGSHLENYQNSLDLSNATLEIGTRIDIARFSASSRDLLGFQLPTDLTTTSEEINRRNLQNQISSYQNSSSCGGSSEKSPSDMSKKCGGKSKRVRTIFTPEQLERLEAEFERQQYMVGPERLYLAHTLQLTEAQVKVWFQNRRIKWRKQHLELQQQRLAAIKQQNQRGEMDETDDEESGDSNNYSFSADAHGDNATTGTFFKSVEPDADSDLGQQYQRERIVVTPPSSLSYRDNPGDNTNKNETNVENA